MKFSRSRFISSLSLALILSSAIVSRPVRAKSMAVTDFSVAVAKHKSGDYNEAVCRFTQILKANPQDVGALRYRATSYARLGKAQLAIADLEKTIAIEDVDSWTFSTYGHMLESLGKYEDAILAYRKAIELGGVAFENYNDLNSALIHVGRFEEGLLWSERAIAKLPGNASLHVTKAHMLYALDKIQTAWREIELASSMGDFSVYMYDVRARILKKKGELTAAIACLKAGVAVHPSDAFLHCQLSDLYLESGKVQNAKSECELAVRLDPAIGYPQAREVFTAIDEKKAFEYAVRAVELNPLDGGELAALGLLKQSKGDNAGAFRDFDKSAKLEPWNYLPHSYKAYLLDLSSSYDEAIVEYEKAEALGGSVYNSSASIAFILMLQKKWDRAEICFDKAIEYYKDRQSYPWAGLYCCRASCRYKQGKFDSAVQDYALSYKLERSSMTMDCWRKLLWERRDCGAYLNTFVTEYFPRT